MRTADLQTIIAAQAQHLKLEGHTPTVLRLGRLEDEVLLRFFKRTQPKAVSDATTLHGFAYSGMSIYVTNQQTGVQAS